MPDKNISKNIPKIIKAVELMTGEQGASIEELEQSLGIKRRSVFRLINTIEKDLAFPVTSKRDGFGGQAKYRLPGKYLSRITKMAVPRLSLNFKEVTLLQFLLTHDTIFRDSKISDDIQSLKKKLNTFLPRETKEYFSGSNSNFFLTPVNSEKSYKGKEDIIGTIMEALAGHKACMVTYNAFSSGKEKTYTIYPLKMLHHRGGLYIIVKIPKHDSITPLAVERIQSLELLNKNFIPPPDSDIKSLLGLAFDLTFNDPVTAKIHFSANVTPYICERRWSDRQTLDKHEDGSCTLTITTTGKSDLMFWLLCWGSDAEVLSPKSFRQFIAEEIRQMGEVYGGQKCLSSRNLHVLS